MAHISRFLRVTSFQPDGCASCECTLFEGTLAAHVDGKLTCKPCVDKLIDGTTIGRRRKERIRPGAS